MFSDLNRYAIKPTKSINILFNSREESSVIAKAVIETADVFKGLVEKEKTTISNRAKALFTLSAICTATTELLRDSKKSTDKKIELAVDFWNQIGVHIPEWNMVKEGSKRSSDVRKESICSLSITLVAIGTAGRALIAANPDNWKEHLLALDQIDWRKTNPTWNNLVFVNGKVAANRSTQHAMSSYIEKKLLQG
ncbi:MAG: DNA sulfur modification protein DndB [Parasporobacterium sp.]|nr:DNA sulfur modification protein DndB [Parasporobacterium sp.]